jgi:glucose/arabinose dehydrogenase
MADSMMKSAIFLLCTAAFAQSLKLPAPYATPSASNGAKVVPRPNGAELKLPKGFEFSQYSSGFERPRFMLLGPNNEVLLSDMAPGPNGAVYVLTDNGKQKKKLIEGLDRPYGLAIAKDYLYVGEPTSVKRYKYDAKAMSAGPGEEVVAMKDFGKGHITRSILFSPKGDKMYVGVGSSGNVVEGDPAMRAAINRFNPDGSGHEIWASGLRNPVGLRFYPGSETIWTSVQERDGLGDDLVPDYFTHVQSGGFYGWPYSYLGKNEDPRITTKHPELVAKTIVPDVILQPHCAVLDFIFYTGKDFPADYRGGAFLANHGSSNRAKRLGYSVSFVPFKKGKPSGPARDFLTGWMGGPDEREVWGRPVGLLQLADGSLLISDDGGKAIWHVWYDSEH